MRAFIQADKQGIPKNYNIFCAFQGFREMGIEIILFSDIEKLQESKREEIVVGYLSVVRGRLQQFNIDTPDIDYPDELNNYLKRKIWKTKINTINSNPQLWPVFVKPKDEKKFTGTVIRSTKDLIGLGSCYDNAEIWCSEVLDILAEWRVFVRYGKIIDIRLYKGDWHQHYDAKIIEQCVKAYKSAPSAYAVDFGITAQGETILIEVNDAYSLSCYGLFYIDYAKLLLTRWAELTGTEDLL